MATTPPTEVRSASETVSDACSWLTSKRTAVGTIP